MAFLNKIINLFFSKTFLTILLGGSVSAAFVTFFLQPQVTVHASLIQPFPNPRDNGRVQALVIRNDGNKTASKITIKTFYPRVVQPLDYRIQSMDDPVYETRKDDYLKFEIDRLAKGDYLIVSFAVDNNEINPSNVRIVHDDGVLEYNNIEHIKLNKWGN